MLVWLFTFILNAHSYETWIEAKSLKISDFTPIESYRKVDSEYDSHRINYGRSVQEEFLFLNETKILDLAVGSISSNEFFNDYRLKLLAPLNENIDFSFYYFDHGDFEKQIQSTLLKLTYKYTPQWSFSILGNTFYKKEENDLGFQIKRNFENSSLELTSFMSDFQRNDRETTNQEWGKHKEPVSWTLTWHHKPKSIYIYGQYEQPSVFVNTANQDKSKYERFVLGGFHITPLSESLELTHRLQIDETKTQSPSQNQELNRLHFSQTLRKDMVSYVTEIGLHYFYRDTAWNQQTVRSHSVLPSLWFYKDSYSIGYDLTYFARKVSDSSALGISGADDIENRLNLGYKWSFQNKSYLQLLFTIDIDSFGTSKTWQGGAGKFVATF